MRNNFKVLLLVMVLFITRPALSFADWNNGGNNHGGHDQGGHYQGGHDSHQHNGSYVGVDFSVWPDSYYYSSPYNPMTDAVLVSPPVYEPIDINGTTYYLNNGTYYIYNGYGYQAVMPPTMAEVQQPATIPMPPVTTAPSTEDSDSVTINIPNDQGGYTAVTLKRSGNGFIGPQGEFYPEFPKVSQLKIIYGK